MLLLNLLLNVLLLHALLLFKLLLHVLLLLNLLLYPLLVINLLLYILLLHALLLINRLKWFCLKIHFRDDIRIKSLKNLTPRSVILPGVKKFGLCCISTYIFLKKLIFSIKARIGLQRQNCSWQNSAQCDTLLELR